MGGCFANGKQAYSPESGGRSFEENQRFFESAAKENTWLVKKVEKGEFRGMPEKQGEDGGDGETAPLLRRRS